MLDYEVGYGRPPKSSQFRKGISGNPKGRPKDSKNLNTIFNEIVRQKVTVNENGRSKTLLKIETCFTN